jgi:hypothetical protein
MTALYHNERRRVYRPDECPDVVRDKALSIEAEGIEPDFISESVFGECGLPYEEKERGIRIATGKADSPSWSIGSKGAGVGLVGSVSDFPAFVRYLETEGKLSRHEGRRLRYLDSRGDLSLSFHKRRGYGEGTVAEFEASTPEYPTAELTEAVESLRSAWEDYVSGLARRALRALEAEYEYLTSWETLARKLADFGEGLDERGRAVPLVECEEGPDPEE